MTLQYGNNVRIVYDKSVLTISDGIDGKQARRTQTSGPLGELFDHGLDSWSTMYITTALYSVFGKISHILHVAFFKLLQEISLRK